MTARCNRSWREGKLIAACHNGRPAVDEHIDHKTMRQNDG